MTVPQFTGAFLFEPPYLLLIEAAVQRDPVNPSLDIRFSAELLIAVPQLDQDFLEHIVNVIPIF